jgi:hypothetical protein
MTDLDSQTGLHREAGASGVQIEIASSGRSLVFSPEHGNHKIAGVTRLHWALVPK